MDHTQIVYNSERYMPFWYNAPAISNANEAHLLVRDLLKVSRYSKHLPESWKFVSVDFVQNNTDFEGLFTPSYRLCNIKLATNGQRLSVLIHEVTHFIEWELLKTLGHGKIFVKLYAELLCDAISKETAKEFIDTYTSYMAFWRSEK